MKYNVHENGMDGQPQKRMCPHARLTVSVPQVSKPTAHSFLLPLIQDVIQDAEDVVQLFDQGLCEMKYNIRTVKFSALLCFYFNTFHFHHLQPYNLILQWC